MTALARWCFRHRIVVLLLWLGALFGTAAGGSVGGSAFSNAFDVPGTESTRAMERMEEVFPEAAGDVSTVVWRTENGTVRDPAVRDRMTDALRDIEDLPHVGDVLSPYDSAETAHISDDGKIAYAEVIFTEQANELDKGDTEKVIDRAQDARTDGLDVELGGMAVEYAQQPAEGAAELVGVVAAAVVLLIAFGSLFGMLLPIITAIVAVGTAVSLLGVLSHVMTLPASAPIVGSLIGLGVGIDYALFVVTRHRKGLKAGLSPEVSAERALNTSGRAVVFAGGTVCVAFLAMFALGMQFLNGLAVAVIVVVLLSVACAATLLPALLGLFGTKVLSRRERRAQAEGGGRAEDGAGSLAVRWAAFVEGRPGVVAVVAVAVMVLLALPAFSLRLGATDQGNHPESQTTRQAYDLLADGFGPGFNGPLHMVADVPGGEADLRAVEGLVDRVRALDGVADVGELTVSEGTGTRVYQVVPAHAPQDEATDELIAELRGSIVPQAERGSTLEVSIGGNTAVQKDFAEAITDRLPLFIALIAVLGALLLMVAFRSVVVPLIAALMNVLAAGAAFGIIVAVFQWGWGLDLLGLGKEGPITSYIPAFMLPLLFGLSMDYQVFLVSRMHEEWVHTRDNARAVRLGLTDTSRVINCAALIMVCVFGSFLLSADQAAVMTGVALAGAVAVDAFIVRMLLVPALMHIIGDANWWLPGPLGRVLPRVALEAPADQVAPASQKRDDLVTER
ncbi:MMPL family transporter [Streptomyces marokkonensis]|uniref:MMPL family transporter n=1 Tax=Streptomyces marokkonensis TaxID=324855 RepID=UPI0011F17A60|nr:MMPL family transporter [Streptomyces marokkonensis]